MIHRKRSDNLTKTKLLDYDAQRLLDQRCDKAIFQAEEYPALDLSTFGTRICRDVKSV